MGQLVQRQGSNRDAAQAAAAVAAAPQQYLTFTLGGEMFAVAILNVKEIIEFGSLTEIPMTPPFIRGVINLRGAVVPVIDLACRFGGRAAEVARRTCIVIVELEEDEQKHDIGVMVDAVSEVLEIVRADIEPPPTFGARIRADFISGMGKINGKFVIILNVAKALSASEIALLTTMGDPDAPNEGEP
ncbi:chemotaxis protein CheW [Rhodocyclus tenuis]|uniref:chemotaxis protein CheW n=1 Tax=Rhodocyclus tenuis TaxID=1066 RepID=UPI00190373BD|nr:chemotaxis protein CheW [Rhodocyclus tenuis]MBK1680173.1 chemotaxis protein CheW [Rhodocyclus tenuis]